MDIKNKPLNLKMIEEALTEFNNSKNSAKLKGRTILIIKETTDGLALEVKRQNMFEKLIDKIKHFFGFSSHTSLENVMHVLTRFDLSKAKETVKILNAKVDIYNSNRKNNSGQKIAKLIIPNLNPTNNISTPTNNSLTDPIPGPLQVAPPTQTDPLQVQTTQIISNPKELLLIDGRSVDKNQPVPDRGKVIGALGNQWTYNSDHLPISCDLVIGPGRENNSISSFNVCGQQNIGWIYNKGKGGTQGLDGSSITQNNIPDQIVVADGKEVALTLREKNLIKDIHTILTGSPIHAPQSCLCLQECGPEFLAILQATLSPNYKIVIAEPGSRDTQAYIYNSNFLTLERNIVTPFTQEANKKITDLIFSTKYLDEERNFYKIRVIGVHVPGNPLTNHVAHKELGDYLVRTSQDPFLKDLPVVLLGDMNTKGEVIRKAIAVSFNLAGIENPYVCLTKGTITHVNTAQRSEDYDSIHVSAGKVKVDFHERDIDSILPGLKVLQDFITTKAESK